MTINVNVTFGFKKDLDKQNAQATVIESFKQMDEATTSLLSYLYSVGYNPETAPELKQFICNNCIPTLEEYGVTLRDLFQRDDKKE